MPGDQRATDALASAAGLGAFFATAPAAGPGWTSWDELTGEPAVLALHLTDVGRALAAPRGGVVPEAPVSASTAHLGLVARLVAPVLGAALTSGTLPVAAPASVHLRLPGANPLPLALGGPAAVAADRPGDLADAFTRHWLTPAIAPLGAAVQAASGVSPQVLDGNVLSAVAGALRMAAAARPELAGRSAAALDDLLRTGPLAGLGDLRQDGSFVRRSCCLFYRLPGAGTCGDCVLRTG
ncbi:(2Fe-2S)-binding protein [Blastococcus sp. SYSU D01042]